MNLNVKNFVLYLFASVLFLGVGVALAQENAPETPSPEVVEPQAEENAAITGPVEAEAGTLLPAESPEAIVETVNEESDGEQPQIAGVVELNPNDIPSLLFTYWERIAINDARRSSRDGSFKNTEDDSGNAEVPVEERIKPPPEEREISLGGIVYVALDDWTIWLNGERVTPQALPKEILDLKVHEEFIEVKWFDEWSNQIFPIRLRPHQRFNIDTRIFLPG